MNPRVTTIVLGAIIFGLGLVALLFPQFAMDRILGFAVAPSHAANAVLGEIRATYGGLFVVMGLCTLLAALDPAEQRGRLQLIGCLWLGASLGRLSGAYIDGDPGVMGWLAVAFEAAIGFGLIGVPYLKGSPAPASAPATNGGARFPTASDEPRHSS